MFEPYPCARSSSTRGLKIEIGLKTMLVASILIECIGLLFGPWEILLVVVVALMLVGVMTPPIAFFERHRFKRPWAIPGTVSPQRSAHPAWGQVCARNAGLSCPPVARVAQAREHRGGLPARAGHHLGDDGRFHCGHSVAVSRCAPNLFGSTSVITSEREIDTLVAAGGPGVVMACAHTSGDAASSSACGRRS